MNIKLFWNRTFAVRSFPPTWFIFQRLGGLIAYIFVKLRIHPNLITLFGSILGTYSCYYYIYSNNNLISSVKLSLLLSLVYIMDCTDGQVARATNKTSLLGKYLDLISDFYLNIIFPLSCGYYLYILLDDKVIFLQIFLLIFSRNFLLFIFSNQRSDGIIHKPSSSNIKRIVQILYDTPIFYIILCFSRLNSNLLLISINSYVLLYLVIFFYKRKYSD